MNTLFPTRARAELITIAEVAAAIIVLGAVAGWILSKIWIFRSVQ